jgi:hypothetical protein
MTPVQHFDALAIACIKKAIELEALAEKNHAGKENFIELAAKERAAAISYLDQAKTLAASANYGSSIS